MKVYTLEELWNKSLNQREKIMKVSDFERDKKELLIKWKGLFASCDDVRIANMYQQMIYDFECFGVEK